MENTKSPFLAYPFLSIPKKYLLIGSLAVLISGLAFIGVAHGVAYRDSYLFETTIPVNSSPHELIIHNVPRDLLAMVDQQALCNIELYGLKKPVASRARIAEMGQQSIRLQLLDLSTATALSRAAQNRLYCKIKFSGKRIDILHRVFRRKAIFTE